jgi:Fe-S-cluster containining protein
MVEKCGVQREVKFAIIKFMKKIKISKISEEVYSVRGFDEQGCIGSACQDMCCAFGADVDKESYDLIREHRAKIEHISSLRFEDFFEQKWSDDRDFLGGNSIRSRISTAGCVFRLPGQKGCVLFKLAEQDNLPRRIIPSICRLFPLTWNNETLEYYAKEDIPATCTCRGKNNITERTIFETQQEAINDIFEIDI